MYQKTKHRSQSQGYPLILIFLIFNGCRSQKKPAPAAPRPLPTFKNRRPQLSTLHHRQPRRWVASSICLPAATWSFDLQSCAWPEAGGERFVSESGWRDDGVLFFGSERMQNTVKLYGAEFLDRFFLHLWIFKGSNGFK